MKAIVLFILGMILSVITFGQNERSNSLEKIEVIPPTFSADEKTLYGNKIESIADYLRINVQYPEDALNKAYQGTEVIQFLVTTTGDLTDMFVINSVCPEIDNEVIHVLEFTKGRWRPAFFNGEPAAMQIEVSVVFQLEGTDNFLTMAKNYFKKGNKMLFVKNDIQKALECYEKGVTLFPYDDALLEARAICKFKLGDEEGAFRDLERCRLLSDYSSDHFEPIFLTGDFHTMDGYFTFDKIKQK